MLFAAAAFLKRSLQEAATLTVKDLFEAARYYLRRKFGTGSDGAKVLELAVEKPESAMRRAVLAEELAIARLATDGELQWLVEQLAALLPLATDEAGQHVSVRGDGNRVQVAGRDLVVRVAKHVQRNVITPDERHVTLSSASDCAR